MLKPLLPLVGVALSSLLLFTTCSVGWAASSETGGHGSGSSLLTLGFFTINFLIFVFVIRKFTLDLIRRKLKERREAVVQALEEAKQAKEAADTLRQEYAAKLANLAAEEEQLHNQALEAAERERHRLMEEAQQVAERARTEVQLIAQREVEQARRLLRREVATQAVMIATKLIQKNIVKSDNRRLVQKLLQEVRSAGNTGS